MHLKIVYTAVLLSLLFLTSCSEQNKSREAIRQEVARWSGKQIQLPSDVVFFALCVGYGSLPSGQRIQDRNVCRFRRLYKL